VSVPGFATIRLDGALGSHIPSVTIDAPPLAGSRRDVSTKWSKRERLDQIDLIRSGKQPRAKYGKYKVGVIRPDQTRDTNDRVRNFDIPHLRPLLSLPISPAPSSLMAVEEVMKQEEAKKSKAVRASAKSNLRELFSILNQEWHAGRLEVLSDDEAESGLEERAKRLRLKLDNLEAHPL
jgi:hypothetical protein